MFAPARQAVEQAEGLAPRRLVLARQKRRPLGLGRSRRLLRSRLGRRRLPRLRRRQGAAEILGLQTTQPHQLRILRRAVRQAVAQIRVPRHQGVAPGHQRIILCRRPARQRVRIGDRLTDLQGLRRLGGAIAGDDRPVLGLGEGGGGGGKRKGRGERGGGKLQHCNPRREGAPAPSQAVTLHRQDGASAAASI